MASLMAQPAVAHALTDIEDMQTELLVDLIELNEIPAPPFGEQARAERFAEKLREAGLTDVSIDAEGNAIGRRPGRSGERVVALTAHLDTVFPAETDVRVRVEGDTLYAPADVLARSERLLLHAASLSFPHPGSGRLVSFCSPCPF